MIERYYTGWCYCRTDVGDDGYLPEAHLEESASDEAKGATRRHRQVQKALESVSQMTLHEEMRQLWLASAAGDGDTDSAADEVFSALQDVVVKLAKELDDICKVLFGDQSEKKMMVARAWDFTPEDGSDTSAGDNKVITKLVVGETVGVIQYHEESGWAWVRVGGEAGTENEGTLGWAPQEHLCTPLPEWITSQGDNGIGASGYWFSKSQSKYHKVTITKILWEHEKLIATFDNKSESWKDVSFEALGQEDCNLTQYKSGEAAIENLLASGSAHQQAQEVEQAAAEFVDLFDGFEIAAGDDDDEDEDDDDDEETSDSQDSGEVSEKQMDESSEESTKIKSKHRLTHSFSSTQINFHAPTDFHL